ncbi:MAG: hypothetical protein QM778_30155 [Myxococcales bacterium]
MDRSIRGTTGTVMATEMATGTEMEMVTATQSRAPMLATAARPVATIRTAPNLEGCTCSTKGKTRACYTGPADTRNVGACKDGVQTCTADGNGEFVSLVYSACSGETLPSGDSCSVKQPENPCQQVQGQNGNTTVNGVMYCEGDTVNLFGDGGIFGGIFGP